MAINPTVDLTVFTWKWSPAWYRSTCPQLNMSELGVTPEDALNKLQKAITDAIEYSPEMLHRLHATTIAVITLDTKTGEPV